MCVLIAVGALVKALVVGLIVVMGVVMVMSVLVQVVVLVVDVLVAVGTLRAQSFGSQLGLRFGFGLFRFRLV